MAIATAVPPKDQDRIWKKIISVLQTVSGKAADDEVGASTANRAKRRCWAYAGTPSSTAPTGMAPGDFILDTTNDEVYRYIGTTVYVNMTADT